MQKFKENPWENGNNSIFYIRIALSGFNMKVSNLLTLAQLLITFL
jgi:hypothetical protein